MCLMEHDDYSKVLSLLYRAHPWHGVDLGAQAPDVVSVFVELSPTDNVKYELDKTTGFLKVDRPQRFSVQCPSIYGLMPQTLCGRRAAEYCEEKTGRKPLEGDNDPLDICV